MTISGLALPSISIVTPNYNGQDYLQTCLTSVLEQNVRGLEYVVVDGASRDNSALIINQFSPRLSKVIIEKDTGHANALNKGFAATSGEIMGWLNSDDVLFEGTLSFVQRLFAAYPEIEWITGRASSMDATGEVSNILPARPWSRLRFLCGDHAWIQQESTFWRRSLWERAGGQLDEGLTLANDFDLWMRFFRHAELHTVDRHLGCFRVRPGQRSVVHQKRYREEALQVIARELDSVDPGYRRAFQHILPERPRELEAAERSALEPYLSVCDPTVLKSGAVYRAARKLSLSEPEGPTQSGERFSAPSDLEPLRGKHRGERCFILGNGPSLNETDLSLLRNETVFGCNGIFLLFDKIDWRPTYYTCVDTLVLPDRAEDIRAMLDAEPSMTSFFPTRLVDHTGVSQPRDTREIIPEGPNRFYFNERSPSPGTSAWAGFSPDPEAYLVRPHTVTVTMLQLAAHMGFSEIYLVGCDTSYTLEPTVVQDLNGDNNRRIVLTSTADDDSNHFDARYFGAQRQWHMPDINAIVLQYEQSKAALESLGIQVYNATVGGALEVFERISLEDAVARSPRPGRQTADRPQTTSPVLPTTSFFHRRVETLVRLASNNRWPVLGVLVCIVALAAGLPFLPTLTLKLSALALALSGVATGAAALLAVKLRRIILRLLDRLSVYERVQARTELSKLELIAKLEEIEYVAATSDGRTSGGSGDETPFDPVSDRRPPTLRSGGS